MSKTQEQVKQHSYKNPKHIFYQLLFPMTGFLSLVWVLFRVLPKPSRLNYPCVKAAAPVATGFLAWLFASIALTASYLKTRSLMRDSRPVLAGITTLIMLLSSTMLTDSDPGLYADHAMFQDITDQPVGEAKGSIPGRVVWAHDRDATNSQCSLEYGDGYFLSKNTDIETVQRMVDASVRNLTGLPNLSSAWEKLFVYFNEQKARGIDRGYQAGEKIFIKANFVNSSQHNSNFELFNKGSYKSVRTSPQVILAVLRHLVHTVGVAQEDISVGDPMQSVVNSMYDVWIVEFPNVKYIDQLGGKGRTKAQRSDKKTIFYSDRGKILREGDPNSWENVDQGDPVTEDAFYSCIENADYMINIAALKAHHRAGVSLCAKNHFGSHTRSSARQLHMGLVNPNGVPEDDLARFGYGQYRIQVDLLGHKYLGGNTVLSIVDGLWGGPDAGAPPKKFKKSPFSNDWSSSILMSQDVVALESVCFDILKNEFPNDHPGMYGVDDYLLQAASSEFWPEGLQYDPENDGTLLGSLGVHEHWNNASDRQYSRNLGKSEGIELLYLNQAQLSEVFEKPETVQSLRLFPNYPNPFNPTTTIHYELDRIGDVQIAIYSVSGQRIRFWSMGEQSAGAYQIRWDGKNDDGNEAGAGLYCCLLRSGSGTQSIKMTLLR